MPTEEQMRALYGPPLDVTFTIRRRLPVDLSFEEHDRRRDEAEVRELRRISELIEGARELVKSALGHLDVNSQSFQVLKSHAFAAQTLTEAARRVLEQC